MNVNTLYGMVQKIEDNIVYMLRMAMPDEVWYVSILIN